MNLHSLKTTVGSRRARKRVGRGRASGSGKTCGRGYKGQMSRKGHKHKLGFEGGQMRLIRRGPKRGFHNPTRCEFWPVGIGRLAAFPEGTEVTPALLRERGIAKGRRPRIKILADGTIERKLTVKAHAFSAAARAKIEAAGGTCEVVKD